MNPKPLPLLLFLTALSFRNPLGANGQAGTPAADPFLKSNAPPAAAGIPASSANATASLLPREGLVRMEVFTLSLDEGRAATRKFPKQAELYAWLGAELEKEKSPVKLERIMVLRVRGGQRSKLEEIAECPFPTEYDPPQIPQCWKLQITR